MNAHPTQNNQSTPTLNDRLRELGAAQYDLWLPETKVLPKIIYKGEDILGIVYGRYTETATNQTGRGALVATTQRILLIDKKPLFMKCDELMHSVISAVSYSKAGVAGTVTLHTKMGDINVRTFNHTCAATFVDAIENNIIRSEN